MSKFKSYTDKDGNKVKIGDWVEVISFIEKDIEKIGKIDKITNETFEGITVTLEGNKSEHIFAKRTRKLNK